MKAMILAAGLGTRLRPLTLVRPKVLVPINGSSVLDFWIERLCRAGFEAVVINAYHLHERLVDAVCGRPWPIPVRVCVEPLLLGTGGGVRNVLDVFEEQPFLVVNGDILCDVSLEDLQRRYFDSPSPAGLLMHDCPEFNNVAVNSHGFILGFGPEAAKLVAQDAGLRLLAFTGIHIIHPQVLSACAAGCPGDILTAYRAMIHGGMPPLALQAPELFWREIGSIAGYRRLHGELGGLEDGFLSPLPTGKAVWIDPEARVLPDVRLKGYVSVGRGTRVAHGVELQDTILWDDVEVRPGSRLRQCVVADGVTVEGIHENEVIVGSLE